MQVNQYATLHPTIQHRQRWQTTYKFIAPLIAIIVISIVLLLVPYAAPVNIRQDIGTTPHSFSQLYSAEANDRYSYAYTLGETLLRLPQVGGGRFVIELRMAGVGEAVPIQTWINTGAQQLNLDHVQQLRSYHLLVPNNADDLQLQLHSETVVPPNDGRELGVLLDAVSVRSLGFRAPAVFGPLSITVSLLLLWIGLYQLNRPYRLKLAALALLSLAMYVVYFLSNDRTIAGLTAMAVMSTFAAAIVISRVDGRHFATPVVGIALLFGVWRLALWVIGGLGLWYSHAVFEIGKHLTLNGALVDRQHVVARLFTSAWMHFDSGHYQKIVMSGYRFAGERWPNVAFFPLYPGLIRLLLPLTDHNFDVAALLISHAAFVVALLLLYDLIATNFGKSIAYRTLIFLLLFPTSLFFVAGYTESLALGLLVGVLWALQRQRWWLAGACGGLLALTRLPGVMVAPIIALVYLQHHKWQWRAIRSDFLAVLLPPIGLSLFMAFQWYRFGTPFAFLLAQQSWGGRSQPPWVSALHLVAALPQADLWPILLFQVVVWLIFVVLLVIAFKRLPLMYSFTMLLMLVPPYISNQYGSLPRYVLMGFPAFIVLAVLAERVWFRRITIGVMLPLLVLSVVLFVNGFWVA